jgi:hypothetical protein
MVQEIQAMGMARRNNVRRGDVCILSIKIVQLVIVLARLNALFFKYCVNRSNGSNR